MPRVLEDQLVLDKLASAGGGKARNIDYRKSALRRWSVHARHEAEIFGVVGLAYLVRALSVVILQIVTVIAKPGFVHPSRVGDLHPDSPDHHVAVEVGITPVRLESQAGSVIVGVTKNIFAIDGVSAIGMVVDSRNEVVGTTDIVQTSGKSGCVGCAIIENALAPVANSSRITPRQIQAQLVRLDPIGF